MYGFLIVAALLVVAAGLFLLSHSSAVEERCQSLERELASMRSAHETTLTVAADAQEAARRAHLRLDTHDRQLDEIGRDIGWSDERAHTRVLTQQQERAGGSLPQRELGGGLQDPDQTPEHYESLFEPNELDELLSKKA